MDGADGIESDALQAGGRRFDPGHVHQPFSFQQNSGEISLEYHLLLEQGIRLGAIQAGKCPGSVVMTESTCCPLEELVVSS